MNAAVTATRSITYLKHSQLKKNPNNRSVERSAKNVKDRAATIKELGILQNIVVSPIQDEPDMYQIEAGNGRYDSVALLISKGDVSDDFEYPALISIDNTLSELIQLAENRSRDNFHPVDEFKTYAQAIAAGIPIKTVANTNGVTLKYVKQRLLLAKVSPLILDAFIAGDLDLEAVEAYTICPETNKQELVFKQYKGSWQANQASAIKKALTEDKIKGRDSLAKFVDEKEYKKAGGNISTCLFEEEKYFEDPEILRNLAKEQLQAECTKLINAGWSWAEHSLQTEYNDGLSTLNPTGFDFPKDVSDKYELLVQEMNTLNELEETTDEQDKRKWEVDNQIDEMEDLKDCYEVYDAEEMKRAGCKVSVTYGGNLCVIKGLIKKEDEKVLNEGNDVSGNPTSSDLPQEEGGYSQALQQDLADTRSAIIQSSIARHPDVAYDITVFTIADPMLTSGIRTWAAHPLELNGRENNLSGADEVPLSLIEQDKKQLNLKWTHGEEDERFEKFCKLSSTDKSMILAFCTARTLTSKLNSNSNKGVISVAIERMNINFRAAWTPSQKTFFKRISIKELLNIGGSIFGQDWSNRHSDNIKKDLVSTLSEAFNANDLEKEEQDKIDTWIPSGF